MRNAYTKDFQFILKIEMTANVIRKTICLAKKQEKTSKM